jgi:hypothetical protein
VRLFGGAPIDEVALRERVQPHVAALRGALPDREALRRATAADGIDFATVWLHEALLASPHGELARRLEGRRPLGSGRARPVRVIVVPTLFYREHPEIGGDGALVVAVARRLGLQAECAPVRSLGSVSRNAAALFERLARVEEDEAWVVTLSKGGLELKQAFALAAGGPALEKVRVWVNIAGVLGGSPLVDRMAGALPRRLFVRAYLTLRGGEGDALLEMGRAHGLGRAPLLLPPRVDVINVVPLPLPSHLARATYRNFRRLEAEGPNDGFVPFWDAVAPGAVYAVWGADHYMRTPGLSLLVHQLLGDLLERGARGELRAAGGRA